MQLLAKFHKNLYMGFRATLTFENLNKHYTMLLVLHNKVKTNNFPTFFPGGSIQDDQEIYHRMSMP